MEFPSRRVLVDTTGNRLEVNVHIVTCSSTVLNTAVTCVNRAGLEGIPGLFAENERICASMRTGADIGAGGRLCLVAVGATMVGKVRVVFDDLSSNRPAARRLQREYADGAVRFEKGAEWGRFEFGSTLVLVAEPGWLELEAQAAGTMLRLGRRIGRLKPLPARA